MESLFIAGATGCADGSQQEREVVMEGNVVEAPTWHHEDSNAQPGIMSTVGIEGGIVVVAPTWQERRRDVQDHDMSMTVGTPPPDMSNPNLERGWGFPWDRVVPVEVSEEGGNQLTSSAIDSENAILGEEMEEKDDVELVLKVDANKAVDCEVDEQSY